VSPSGRPSAEAEQLALADPGVQRALAGRGVAKVIVRVPKMVSIVPVG
jgi:leucyl-tRNA synthetase